MLRSQYMFPLTVQNQIIQSSFAIFAEAPKTSTTLSLNVKFDITSFIFTCSTQKKYNTYYHEIVIHNS